MPEERKRPRTYGLKTQFHRAASSRVEGENNNPILPFVELLTRHRTYPDQPRQRDSLRSAEEGNAVSRRSATDPDYRPSKETPRVNGGVGPHSARDVNGAVGTNSSPLGDVQAEDKLDVARSTSPGQAYPEEGFTGSTEKEAETPHVNGVTKSNSENTEGQPRRRGKFKSLFKKEKKEEESVNSEDDSLKKAPHYTFGGQLRAVILGSWINVLLLAVPVGIALNYAHVDPIIVFVVNFIAIVPLAAMLSYATEELALRTGETIGGLLNATFGNAVELIVSIIALIQNEILVVKTSLIGSMLSNLLLVLGMCFFFGGLNRTEQNFNVVVAQTAASLLALAIGSLIIPTAFEQHSSQDGTGVESNGSSVDERTKNLAPLSRGTAIILLFVYGCYLFFQLKTHIDVYNAPSEKVEKRSSKKKDKGDASRGIANIGGAFAASTQGEQVTPRTPDGQSDDGEDDGEVPQLSLWGALITLLLSTVFVALCAEFMVGSIDAVSEHISKTFVGLILLPIVGNAAEHVTAVTVAIKDKMDLAIGVAVGSSMQIALLVLPLAVIIGWIIGADDMDLFFDTFQIAVLFISILLVNYLIADGKSHWLEGVLLIILYVLIGLASWFYG